MNNSGNSSSPDRPSVQVHIEPLVPDGLPIVPSQGAAVQVRIERLLLEGLPLTSGQGAAVQTAFECELSRLLQQASCLNLQSSAMPALTGLEVHVSAGIGPADLGRQLAGSLYESLARSA
jgi:hypothetical protein